MARSSTAAAQGALAARTRRLTGGALALSALLSGAFAGIAAASAPGHRLHAAAATARSTAIPPLPPPTVCSCASSERSLEPHARRAVDTCPVLALKLERAGATAPSDKLSRR